MNSTGNDNKIRRKCFYRLLALLFLAKLGGYAGLRSFYALSRFYEYNPSFGNITSTEMSFLLSAGELAAIPAGFVGPLGEYLGYKYSICISQFLSSASTILLISMKPVAMFSVLLLLRAILGFVISVSSMMIQSAAVTLLANDNKDNTGKLTGVLELSWSLSLLIIFPIATRLFQDLGSNSVWIFLGIIMLIPTPFLFYLLPNHCNDHEPDAEKKIDEHNQLQSPHAEENWIVEANAENLNSETNSDKDEPKSIETKQNISFARSYINVLLLRGAPMWYNLSQIIYNVAHNMMQTSYSYWIVDFYQVTPLELGNYTIILAVAEFVGVLIATFIADKVGLYRSVYSSTLAFGIMCIVHSVCTRISLQAGLGTLFILFIFGEICFVTRIAYAESLVKPEYLTIYLGIFFQMQFSGRAIGAVLANSLWYMVDDNPSSKGKDMSLNHIAVGIGSFIVSVLSFGIVFAMHGIFTRSNNTSPNNS